MALAWPSRGLLLIAVSGVVARGDPSGPVGVGAHRDARVGSAACGACHPAQYAAWRGSHHAAAMQSANRDTVLARFGGETLEQGDQRWRFSRQGDAFVATVESPDGGVDHHPIAFTFGVAPLQQYLVPFPGGRLQCLPAAWDTRARRWFLVAPEPPVRGDWLHWTGAGQTWNAMCADCHSTAVRKGYDPATDRYQTTWSEVSVGCEACHGPGAEHAQRPARSLAIRGRDAVERCAPCHARRAQLADQPDPGAPLLDAYLPSTLAEGVFHPDGQVLGEDFEYQAFTQSKMYARGVRCSDCHDVHSGRLRAEGNALCVRCHLAQRYDAPSHHSHEAGSSGAACVSCHMPAQPYMVVHLRRDHSLRVPRPDTAGPLACAGCHAKEGTAWLSAAYAQRWGPPRTAHYGATLAAARGGDPGAEPELVRLASDRARPAVVRATALELLGEYADDAARTALEQAVSDAEPLVRHAAVSHLPASSGARLARTLAPALEDPIRAVRGEAAARLSEVGADLLTPPQRAAFDAALAGWVADQRYMSDLPSGRYQLGNLAANRGATAEAEAYYRSALELDARFYPAQVNLALLLGRVGRGDEAERLLRAVHAAEPRAAGVAFDLGLLLAERGDTAGAEAALRAALAANPRFPEAAYNLAALIGRARPAEALALCRAAAAQRPDDRRYAIAVASFQLATRDFEAAAATLSAWLQRAPTDEAARAALLDVRSRARGERRVQAPAP